MYSNNVLVLLVAVNDEKQIFFHSWGVQTVDAAHNK